MFAKTIIDSDAFLDMPLSTQSLYFHLSMRADDDGFINNPKKIQRMIGAADDDLKVLVAKNFIIPFESGIVVIKHWKIHNYIRNDRYKETVYKEEKELLTEKENKAYTFVGIPEGRQVVYQTETQVRLGKDSIGKDSIEEYIVDEEKEERTTTIKEIIEYLNLKLDSKYRYSTKSTRESINARLKEGFTLEDFKVVIDKQYDKWINTEWEQYLRPQTLFGTKFESYLNAPTKQGVKKNDEPKYGDGSIYANLEC
jgi:uncharacterized phage protein (TIGR02220 family)